MGKYHNYKDLSHDYLLGIIDYDINTGWFIWKTSAGNKTKGKIAGSIIASGHVRIHIRHRSYMAGRLAMFYMNGKWPDHNVIYKNGIPDDNRWDNLTDSHSKGHGLHGNKLSNRV